MRNLNIFNIEEPIGQAEIQEMLSNYVAETDLPNYLDYKILIKQKSIMTPGSKLIIEKSKLPGNTEGKVLYFTIQNYGSRNVVAIIRCILKSNYPGAPISSLGITKLYDDTTSGATPTITLTSDGIELDNSSATSYSNAIVSVIECRN